MKKFTIKQINIALNKTLDGYNFNSLEKLIFMCDLRKHLGLRRYRGQLIKWDRSYGKEEK